MKPDLQPLGDSTALTVWRFSSIMATAMTMSAAVAHLMELPGKMGYEPRLYVRLHRTLYPTFGKTAGPAEAFAVVATGALAVMGRQRPRRSSTLTAVAAGCLAAVHAVFWGVVQPANVTMMRWPLDEIPPDWSKWRNRWEYGHAVRAGLVTTALGALTWSVLTDPDRRSSRADGDARLAPRARGAEHGFHQLLHRQQSLNRQVPAVTRSSPPLDSRKERA